MTRWGFHRIESAGAERDRRGAEGRASWRERIKRPTISTCVKTRLPILALICSLVTVPVHAREAIHKGDVVVVPLRGEVAPSLLAFLRRAVKTAENNEAISDHTRHEHIWRPARYSDRYRECAQSNQNPDLYVHQHKCRIRGFTYRYCHAPHLHGAGERNWRSCTNPLNRRRPSHYGKGENNFLLVRARPRFRNQERT